MNPRYLRYGRQIIQKRILEGRQRFGIGSDLVYVAEFPRSGGTWISNMVKDMLYQGTSVPENHLTGVLHTHMRHGSRLRPSIYVVRDGRDVILSLYFYEVRHLQMDTPMQGKRAHHNFTYLFGPNYDVDDVKHNLPRYIGGLRTRATVLIPGFRRSSRFEPWPDHVRDWKDRENLIVVRYEDFLDDGTAQLGRIAMYLGIDVQREQRESIVEDHSFAKVTGRNPGEEDRSSFHRKGIAGEWRDLYTPEAARAFRDFAGDVLIELGYESDGSWVDSQSSR